MVEKDALESVGIDMLLRYRDDILILASSYEKFIAWFQKLKSKAGVFKLQCEEIVRFSKVEDKEVQFLQFRVQMNAKSRRLRLIPHSKNISMPWNVLQPMPLQHTSGQQSMWKPCATWLLTSLRGRRRNFQSWQSSVNTVPQKMC